MDDVLTAGRALAEALMTDTWAIGADLGWSMVDGVEFRQVAPLFTTKARLRERGNVVQEAQVGDRTAVETRRELHIPWNSPSAPVNAVAQCTAVGRLSDPTLLGTIVRLSGPAPGSQQTARRLQVVEVLT
ncbi:hypothetical protein GUY44_11945 [Pimelobacter simplex]|uniref:DUF6093 family protein n=1 Tax=Nocardioides simplex TaxID=2045 RepID=UPI0008E3C7AE|nr:DUF6093 family protein [Pimelobacter simplex]MCG8151194.1 hypothetical protein [Pimelobacter simplex]GEB17213.1 hypothetical protein NSI01_55280 [Pimelobacter simplex]SFN18729.1 hypothetical protein SAMN05421671_0009 [Pimelobacter simplex]